MCLWNCFPYHKKKVSKEVQLKPTDKNTNQSSCSTSSTISAEKPEIMPRIYSSPSKMRTAELTDIYKIPNNTFKTVDEVVLSNGFEIGVEIGKGSYATVYKATRIKDNLTVACKVMDITATTRHQSISAKNELFILERINHPHIIKLYKHFIIETNSSRYVYIFMQFAECESLSVYVRKVKTGLPEQTCKRMLAQIVSAVNHMHGKGIAHRDLKMGNVLLNQNYDCLVTDFGLSRVAYRKSKGKILSNKFCGTVPYMAPEILLTKEYQVDYDPFVADIWAIGVILFCIINRGYPFSVAQDVMLEQQMCHKIKFSKKIQFMPTNDLIDLLYRLLDPNMSTRIKMDELMIHPWLKEELNKIEEGIEKSNISYTNNVIVVKSKQEVSNKYNSKQLVFNTTNISTNKVQSSI